MHLLRGRHGDPEKTNRRLDAKISSDLGEQLAPQGLPNGPVLDSSSSLCKLCLHHTQRLPWGCCELHCPPDVKPQVQSVTPSPFSEFLWKGHWWAFDAEECFSDCLPQTSYVPLLALPTTQSVCLVCWHLSTDGHQLGVLPAPGQAMERQRAGLGPILACSLGLASGP